ncbi:MAG TPA: hypothetical protein VHY09_00540 [Candidatus Methylacidiphilales bacterium]|jgi:hypothetical protein|nr:hypothetical protein [Candidatus Methylacidiphilales bacterium]
MKTPSLFKALLALVTLLSFLVLAPTTALADPHPGVWDTRHHYYRDNYGYWDEHDHYRHYVYWHNHHGYWDTRGATRVFINVD